MTATLARPVPAPAAAPRPRPRWERPALAALLLGTAVLYLWNLDVNGWGNAYYAGAVQAMTQDWTAFFFGSLDAGNVVTVDKPPASLWAMALSARLFGLSSWSILVPQALMGVGAVALLHASVRRVAGAGAALLAGAALALTPVAALMFRFDNPDALLVLLLVAAAYAAVRATEVASTRWLVLAGLLVGFAFLAKMAQAFLVLPAFVLAYVVAAPTGFWRRVRQLLGAAVAVVVGAGWWIAIAALWPAGSRPYIGGSEGDSALQLALGYNGLSRLFGGQGGGPRGGPDGGLVEFAPRGGMGGGPGGGGFGGEAGLLRMVNETVGGQVSWLLPPALVLLVVGLWLRRRAPRTDPVRASLLLWGGWTVVTALVFSLMSGIFHDYYTVALAPGVAALVGIGGHELWRRRASVGARALLAVLVAGTAVWAWVLLGRTPDFLPWLRWVVLAAGVLAGVAMLGASAGRRLAVAAVAVAVLAGLTGPAAYAVQTVATANTGSLPHAGPRSDGASGPSTNLFQGGEPAVSTELATMLRAAGTRWSAATVGAQTGSSLALASGTSVISIGGFMGGDPAPTLEEFQAMVAAGEVRYFVEAGGSAAGGPGGGRAFDLDALRAAAATDQRAADLLARIESGGLPGPGGAGDDGGDGRRGPGGPGGGPGSAIASWVAEHYTARTVGGTTVYDLTTPKA